MINRPIDIVLATYNGECYIKEQLDSIISGISYNELINSIIIVDDGSTDSTLTIVSEYCKKYNNIKFFPSKGEKFGPVKNFERGMLLSKADYVMLCDQDDVWLPNKIFASFNKLKEIENGDPSVPCLVFTDLEIVDSALQVVYQSFFDFNKLKFPRDLSLEFIMSNNVAPGCTMIMNNKLISYALPIPSTAIMHDWWLMIFTKCYGRIDVLAEETIMYRQHNNNTVGVKKKSLINKFISLNEQLQIYFSMRRRCIRQVESLIKTQCQLTLEDDFSESLNLYIKPLTVKNFFSKMFWSYKLKTERTILRKVMLFLYIIRSSF